MKRYKDYNSVEGFSSLHMEMFYRLSETINRKKREKVGLRE